MRLDLWLAAPLAHALGRALAHFLWQGAVVAAALRVLLFLGEERSSRWRHQAATACLLALPVAFGITLALSLGRSHSIAVLPAPAPRMVFTPVIAQGAPAAPVDWLAWLAPVWMSGVILFYAFRLAGWVRVDRMRRCGVCAAPPEWQQRLGELAAAVRVSQPVELLESCLAGVPQVIGYWRPVILMPLGALAGLSVQQVEAILIHELAHIRRADYLVGIAQSLIEGLFFFHPAAWWISAVVRAEREYACDDVVVALRPDARAYAAALTTLEQSRWVAGYAAAAANGGNLVRRIRRLLGEPAPERIPTARASALAGALVLVAAVATALVMWPPARSFAQAPAPAESAADKQEPAQGIEPARRSLEELEGALAGRQQEIKEAEQAIKQAQETLRRNAAEIQRSLRNGDGHSGDFAQAEEQMRKMEATLKEFESRAGESHELLDEQRMATLLKRLAAQQAGKSQQLQEVEKQLQELSNGKVDEALRQEQQQLARADQALQKARAAFSDQSFAEIEKELQQAEKVEKEFEQGGAIGVARASKYWGQGNEGALAQAGQSSRPQSPAELGLAYQKWLNEDVAYLITDQERRDFLALNSDADRDQFIEKFWQRRDPPGSGPNVFKQEYYRRIAYANEHFASSVPGWKTDRGRIYITYGPPDQISVSMTKNVLRQVWRYTHIDGLGYDIEAEFTDTGKTDDFHMTAAPASHGAYWQVMTGASDAAGSDAQSLRGRGFPAVAYPVRAYRPSLTQVLVGPYPDDASLAKAKAALEAEGFHPVRAQ